MTQNIMIPLLNKRGSEKVIYSRDLEHIHQKASRQKAAVGSEFKVVQWFESPKRQFKFYMIPHNNQKGICSCKRFLRTVSPA